MIWPESWRSWHSSETLRDRPANPPESLGARGYAFLHQIVGSVRWSSTNLTSGPNPISGHLLEEECFVSLKTLMRGALPVTAPLVLNPALLDPISRGHGLHGRLSRWRLRPRDQKVALEANLNLTEMCQAALDIGAVSSLPLILDGACGFGDPMHMHRTIGMSEAAGFAAIEIEDQLMPKRAHHHIGIEHMIPLELMAAKVREAVAARRDPDFLIVARTNAIRASNMDDAFGVARPTARAGADLLMLSMARRAGAAPDHLRAAWRTVDVPGRSRRAGRSRDDVGGSRRPGLQDRGRSIDSAHGCLRRLEESLRPIWPTASARAPP